MSWSSTRILPMVAVQRIRLLARTAHCNQALLAWKLPDGHVVEAGTFFEVADRELDDGVVAVELVEVTASPARSVRNPKCRQSGHSLHCVVSVKRVRRTIRRRVAAASDAGV